MRSLDAIPFTKDFRFDMEVWHWATTEIDYAVATFWYGFEGTELVDFQSRQDQIAEVRAEVSYKTPVTLKIPGFLIEKIPVAGNVQLQDLTHFGEGKWENNDQLWWTNIRPNDRLELVLETEKEGRYKLVGALTKARDYGIVQFWINGAKVGEPIDLYNPEVIPTGPMEIGSVELKAGKHVVIVEMVGKNEKSTNHMVGIDQLKLVP